MKKEKAKLEIITDYMDYMEYTVSTKWNIKLQCSLRRPKYSITPEFHWEWEIRWVLSESCGEMCWHTELIYATQEQYSLERCIDLMNNFMRENFKTSLD